MKLHANACNYQISRFYTRAITRILHALSTNTTRRLHAFYARVGAAIPLTGTVNCFSDTFFFSDIQVPLTTFCFTFQTLFVPEKRLEASNYAEEPSSLPVTKPPQPLLTKVFNIHIMITFVTVYMASSVRGQDESNPALSWATQAGKMELSCPLGTTCCVLQEKIPRKLYNKSFSDQSCSVKMAGYWPLSYLRVYGP